METTVKVDSEILEKQKRFIVYAGKYNSSRRYIEVEKINSPNNHWILTRLDHFYNKLLFKNKIIGAIFEVEFDNKETVYYNTNAKQVCFLHYPEELAEWKAMDIACEILEGEKKESSNEFKKRLDPIKEAYRSARGVAKQNLIAQVVRYICE